MIRSKNIADYFSVPLAGLRPNEAIPFEVYLYLPLNQRVLLFHRKEEAISSDFLTKYLSRKIENVWIHKDDKIAYDLYMAPKVDPAKLKEAEEQKNKEEEKKKEAQVQAQAKKEEEIKKAAEKKPEEEKKKAEEILPPKTEEGAIIAEVMNSDEIPEETKKEIIEETAQTVLAAVANAQTVEEQKKADEKAKQTVHDVLADQVAETETVLGKLWQMAETQPDVEHAANVATYSVIFALAFGRIDKTLIADIALAGLLHDVGLNQLPVEVTKLPWSGLKTKELMGEYSRHVEMSVDLISRYEPTVPDRVKMLITQHHEKFNGTGYPKQLAGFKVNDAAGLLAVADLLTSINSGRWDGQEKTLKETFGIVEKIEKSGNFPEYFNPEVFKAILRWIRNVDAQKASFEQATSIVTTQAKQVIPDKPDEKKSAA